MARKKSDAPKKVPTSDAYIESAGLVLDQKITDTLTENYMPYAMSVIVSRAIPEIDGFKPSHRKLLYTMYKMGLLSGNRMKSANIVGQTMKLNPHGDAAIYETMVRMARGNETLLHAYIDSKGNFGKSYSSEAYAASRYTEAKLEKIAKELFEDIEKDTVDFVDNYDSTMKEPVLFPVRFPSILINFNDGIAVGMTSRICSFNLKEVCETTIGLLRDEDFDIYETLKAPDFPGGAQIIYDEAEMKAIFETGRGSFKMRSKYEYDKAENRINITEIPPQVKVQDIIEKVCALAKEGKIKEISNIRDAIEFTSNKKIAIDLKRGTDPDKFMQKLFKMTQLEDSFSCNFNVLINGNPYLLGVKDIILEWIAFRTECVKRRLFNELEKKKKKLHLMKGLEKILLDIDKAIKIIRETKEEAEVVPNLMIGFMIDEIQAEYVADIKLRNLNKAYILNRTAEIEELVAAIKEMEDILASRTKVKGVIIKELKEVIETYGQDRKSEIIFKSEAPEIKIVEEVPDYPVHLFFTKEGYFKKIIPSSLRMSSDQKLKEGDEIILEKEANNRTELLFFTDMCQCYKSKASDFDDTKASVMGDYVAAKLGFDNGESAKIMVPTDDYKGHIVMFFENGKAAKVPISAYETKTNRKKLSNAYSDKSKLIGLFSVTEDREFMLTTTEGKVLLVHSGAIPVKTTRNTQGVAVLTLRGKNKLFKVTPFEEKMLVSAHRYRSKNLPAAAKAMKEEEFGEQITL